MTGKKLHTISVRLGDDLYEKVCSVSQSRLRDMSSIIREALDRGLDAMEHPNYETPPVTDPYYGQYREFEIGEHRIGVAVTPWRNEPVVIFHDLRRQGATFDPINLPAHPATDAYNRLEVTRYYHWGTPEFLEFCRTIGLNPEEIRPRFTDGHDALVQRLLERSSRYDDFKDFGPQGIGHYRNYIHDVLDLMRSDREPTAETFLRCCRDLVDWEEQPEASEIRAFLLEFDYSRWSWVRNHPLDRRDQTDPIPFPSQADSNDQ